MDAEHFNQLSRTVAAMTRRRSLRLLSAGVLGSLLVRLELHPVAATHGCRHIGQRCRRSGQCCAPARCKKRKCRCDARSFECGTLCCLNGASCATLPLPGEPKFCDFGDKQPGAVCDLTQPGECASGICAPLEVVNSTGICREADCAAVQEACGGTNDCCEGGCQGVDAACGGGARCCGTTGAPCQENCDCCSFPFRLCRKGRCCRIEGGACETSRDCCGDLVCDNITCVKP